MGSPEHLPLLAELLGSETHGGRSWSVRGRPTPLPLESGGSPMWVRTCQHPPAPKTAAEPLMSLSANPWCKVLVYSYTAGILGGGAELGLASNHGPGRACVPLTVWWVWWCGSLCHRRETEPDRGWLAAQGDQQAADDASVVCERSVSDCASEALQTGGTGGGWLQCAAHCRL